MSCEKIGLTNEDIFRMSSRELIFEDDIHRFERSFSRTDGLIFFKNSNNEDYYKSSYDWYILVALEKAGKVKEDRNLLTRDLILSYRWAIREGYQHQLDGFLSNPYDHPRNRNTINGIKNYIKKIKSKTNLND